MENKLTKLAQAAAIGLALALTFSCSSNDDNGGGGNSDPGGGDYYTPSSSPSSTPSTSNCPSGQMQTCTTYLDPKTGKENRPQTCTCCPTGYQREKCPK